MILESYWRFFSAIFYANEKDYKTSFLLTERIIEEIDRYEDYCDRNQISNKSRAFKELANLRKFTEKEVKYVYVKS